MTNSPVNKIQPVEKKFKSIPDQIYKSIFISNLAHRIIDNKIFQRLRGLRQLGLCYLVYPNATHTRFEHSLGAYHLADELLKTILERTLPGDIDEYLRSIVELKSYYQRAYEGVVYTLDDYVCELVKIAALCHDLGHGPFSHVFDDNFLPYVKKELIPADCHEERSKMLLRIIIKNDPVLKDIILDDDISFMENIIDPKKENVGFLYQIVSNNLNGLDVDKYDYIARDTYLLNISSGFNNIHLINDVRIVGNNIAYSKEAIYEVKRMFESRFSMHKKVYCNNSVVAAQYILIEVFKTIDDILQISNSTIDPNLEHFCELTDEYILNSIPLSIKLYKSQLDAISEMKCCDDLKNNINEKLIILNQASKLLDRLKSHDLYKCAGQLVSRSKIVVNLADLTQDDIKNVCIFQTKLGYVSGNKKNPFENLHCYSYDEDENIVSKKVDFKEITLLYPDSYQEHVTMIFYKGSSKEGYDKICKWSRKIFEQVKNSL